MRYTSSLTRPFTPRFGDDGPFEVVGAEDRLLQLNAFHAEKSHGEGLQGVAAFRHENHAMRRQIRPTLFRALT